MIHDYHVNAYGLQKETLFRRKRIVISCIAVVLLLAIFVLFFENMFIQVETESFPFTESARELYNPNRGFYHLYTFWITDEQKDYEEFVESISQNDTELILVKICLQNYREGSISEFGLLNIDKLFHALETLDQQLIVRFIYDDEGRNEQYEPDSLDIILRHMEQLESVLDAHKRKIFILQGLFTGNWGEMHGTRYDTEEDMKCLADQLVSVTDESIYLSVRTPAQWRSIVQSVVPSEEILTGSQLAARLGLFNDGLLGNRSDFGTYKTEDTDGTDLLGRWSREEELEFQKELCRYTPNGGEVINDNSYNDFENAVEGLAQRRITYLNKDYDPTVLKKWEEATVTEEGCFFGMDGYTYIERHLGYRLLITDTALTYSKERRCISVEVSLKNVGFAPIYKETKINMVLYREDNGELLEKEMSCAVRKLTGGEESDMVQNTQVEISVSELTKTEYRIYFFVEDLDTGKHIELANEQDEEAYGYCIGTVRLY